MSTRNKSSFHRFHDNKQLNSQRSCSTASLISAPTRKTSNDPQNQPKPKQKKPEVIQSGDQDLGHWLSAGLDSSSLISNSISITKNRSQLSSVMSPKGQEQPQAQPERSKLSLTPRGLRMFKQTPPNKQGISSLRKSASSVADSICNRSSQDLNPMSSGRFGPRSSLRSSLVTSFLPKDSSLCKSQNGIPLSQRSRSSRHSSTRNVEINLSKMIEVQKTAREHLQGELHSIRASHQEQDGHSKMLHQTRRENDQLENSVRELEHHVNYLKRTDSKLKQKVTSTTMKITHILQTKVEKKQENVLRERDRNIMANQENQRQSQRKASVNQSRFRGNCTSFSKDKQKKVQELRDIIREEKMITERMKQEDAKKKANSVLRASFERNASATERFKKEISQINKKSEACLEKLQAEKTRREHLQKQLAKLEASKSALLGEIQKGYSTQKEVYQLLQSVYAE